MPLISAIAFCGPSGDVISLVSKLPARRLFEWR